jgi:hypothetical protein
MLGYWLYATHKKIIFWYIYIYMYICHIALKTGYSKYEISILQYKKKKHKK